MIKSLLSLIVIFLNIHIRILIYTLSDPFMDSCKYFQFHGMIFEFMKKMHKNDSFITYQFSLDMLEIDTLGVYDE